MLNIRWTFAKHNLFRSKFILVFFWYSEQIYLLFSAFIKQFYYFIYLVVQVILICICRLLIEKLLAEVI